MPANLPAENDGSNPFEEIGNQAARRIIGTLLKFSKGDYLYGQDNEELPIGTKLIANMDQLLRGWIKWEENKPVEQVMGLISEGFKIPKRETLGDLDETEWELDDRNQPRDPWQETYYLLLRELDKEGNPLEGSDGLYTFTTASTGGKDAVIELCAKYGKAMRMRPNEFPIITIDMEKYNHPNKQYGVIKKPKWFFNVKKDWIAKDKFGNIDDLPPGDDQEDIPF